MKTRRPLTRRLVLFAAMVIAAELALAGARLALPGRHATGRPVPVADESARRRGVSTILRGAAQHSTPEGTPAPTAAVNELLARRAAALLRRDRAAFLATANPDDAGFRQRQGQVFDNMAGMPLGSWSYLVDPSRVTPVPPALVPVYGDELWSPAVRLRYALAGFDATPTTQEARYVFVRHGEGWYLADDGASPDDPLGGGSVRNLWDYGPVTVLSAGPALVLGHPDQARLMRTVQRLADRALPQVSDVWGHHWAERAVFEVPSSVDELSSVVEQRGDLTSIAAFASADTSAAGPPTGERVVVNPAAFPDLSPFGQRIVLTHELAHVATRALTGPATPDWLAEGFADYVAYRNTDLTPRQAARELAGVVRSGRAPAALPTAADFAGGGSVLSASYEAAWLACVLVAQRYGERNLVALYRQLGAAHGDPAAALDTALRRHTGMSTDRFVTTWRGFVRSELA